MVENKSSIYDQLEPEYTPLVPVEQVADDSVVVEPEPSSLPTASQPITSASSDQDEPIPDLNETERLQQQKLVASGVGAGVVGLLFGGPVLGMMLGFGAAYAHDKPGAAGDTARAVGDIALSVRDKAKEIDQKHHVVEKSKLAAHDAWERAKELDRRHNILERTKEKAVQGFHATVDFVKRHNLIERGIDSIGKAVYWLAVKLANALNGNNDANGPNDNSSTPTTTNASSAAPTRR